MKSNVMYWISGIIGVLFLLILIVLKVSDKIKLGGLILFSVIVIILIVSVDLGFNFINSKKKVSDIIKNGKKVLTLQEARNLAKSKLLDKQYADYEKENKWEDVLEMGKNNTPIYFKLVRGEFEGVLYGIIINMQDLTRGGIKEYDDSHLSLDNIKEDMFRRGNLAAFSPAPDVPIKTTTSFDPLTCRSVVQTEPLENKENEKENKGELR